MSHADLLLEIAQVKGRLVEAKGVALTDLVCALIELQSSLINQLLENTGIAKSLT